MVLQGLQHTTYLGWISGVLLLRSPRGTPEAFRRKSPYTVFVIAIYFLNLIFRLDFYLIQSSNLQKESMVIKFLDLSLLVGETCFDLFFRLIFFSRAKLVVRFLKSLESDMKKFAPTLELGEKDRKDWKLSERLVWLTLMFHIVSGILVTVWFSRILAVSSSSTSVLLGFLPQSLHIIFFYIFGELPLTCSIAVTFSMAIVTSFHILWIFYDFCDTLEQQISVHNASVEMQDSQLGFAKHALGELSDLSVFSVAASAMQISHGKPMEAPLGMDKLMGKLEHLKLLCSQYDKNCGHLLLGLIVRAVYVLISAANSILLYDNPRGEIQKEAKHWLDIFTFPTELVQLWLLPMGAVFRKKVNARKEKISRMIIFMTNLDARTDLRNVMTAFTEWDWTLTGGPGFFEVDRSLLSGVVSSLMTYVTIIFQLNAPLDDDEIANDESKNMTHQLSA